MWGAGTATENVICAARPGSARSLRPVCYFATLRIDWDRVPKTRVALYREEDGSCPFVEWFDKLPVKVQDKCYLRLERLGEVGHELRRPEADFLRAPDETEPCDRFVTIASDPACRSFRLGEQSAPLVIADRFHMHARSARKPAYRQRIHGCLTP